MPTKLFRYTVLINEYKEWLTLITFSTNFTLIEDRLLYMYSGTSL